MSFTQVSLSELRPPTPEPLSFDEWLDYAAKGKATGKKECTPGKSYPCKSICLGVAKNCRNPLEGQAKNYSDWLKAGGEKFKATKVQTSLSKKRQASKSSKGTSPVKTPSSSSDFPNRLKGRVLDGAIPDYSVDDFKEYVKVKAKLARNQEAMDAIKDPSLDPMDRNRAIRKAVEDGYHLDDDALSLAKTRGAGAITKKEMSDLVAQNNKNRPEIDALRNRPDIKAVDLLIEKPYLSAEETKGYKPMMSEKEAADYAKDSYMGDWSFHHGSGLTEAIDSITNEGVDVSKNSNGMFGSGFYMGAASSVAEHYAGNSGGEFVSSKVKVKNPYIYKGSIDGRQDAFMSDLIESGDNDEEFYDDMASAFKGRFGANSTTQVALVLKMRGYDSIYVQELGYFIALQKEQVATYKRSEPRDYDQVAKDGDGADNNWGLNKNEAWNELNKIK